MKAALLGFKQSGKSTLFGAISGKAPPLSGSPKTEEAIVAVPDARIDWLTALYRPRKTAYATVDCLDLPGLSFTDPSERVLSRRLIAEAKGVDMFVLVVRSFSDPAVPPYRGETSPLRDLKELQSELLIADLELVTTRIERLEEQIKKGAKSQDKDRAESAVHKRLEQSLEEERPVSQVELTVQEEEIIRPLGLLTRKPIMVVLNVDEGRIGQKLDLGTAIADSIPIVPLCAKLEQDLARLDPSSRREFMRDLGIQESAGERFISGCYSAMGLISFFTVGEDEVRAWPIRKGTLALDAAGKIHSDIKRGFIRAETMAYDDLKALGHERAVKAAGKMRLEGKTYPVRDGDIISFRFNV